MYKGIIKYPRVLRVLARELGPVRYMLKQKTRKPEHERGDKSERTDFNGMLGELIARHHLCELNAEAAFAPLISTTPLTQADVYTGSATLATQYDVKCFGADASRILVNVAQHRNANKKVDKYWIIWAKYDDRAYHFLYTHEQVSQWPIGFFGFSECHWKFLEDALKEEWDVENQRF